MKKKVLSLFLCLLMIVSIVPMGSMTSSAVSAATVKTKLDSFISSYPSGSRWTGTFDGGSQCYGFGKMVIYNIFGKNSSGGYRSWTYAGVSTSGMKVIGSTTSYSEANVKNLLSKARCGDVLQFDSTKQHTMIVYSVDSNGVTIYDCNWDNNCGISKRYCNFGVWSGRNSNKLTLLRSDNSEEPIVVTHTIDSKYSKNFTAYPKEKITASNIFDANHNQISSTAWIGTTDKCTINEVYTDGCCKITYPLDGGGTKTAYSKTSLFKMPTYTVQYSANGGSGAPSNQTKTDGTILTLSSTKPTRTGYTFEGWGESASATTVAYSSGTTYKNNKNVTLYALWTPNKLSVNYNANGGTISSNTYKLSNNIIYKISDNEKLTHIWTYNNAQTNGLYNASTFGLTREGYTFKGWGTTASGGTVFDQDDSTLVPTSINSAIKNGNCSSTLYAIWEKNPATVSSISVSEMPSKTVYTVGETFSSSGLSIKVIMSDGTSKTVTNGFTVSSPDMKTAGTKTVTVTYEGKTTTFPITVNPPATVSSISVNTMPSKTVYTVGETFSSSGLSIKVNMSDGTNTTVTSGFTVSAPDMSTSGTKTVTITYQGKTTTFNITVNAAVSPTAAKYKISGATACAGSTVEIYVSIENNPGIISLRNQIAYDTTALELTKVEDLKLLSGYTTPSPTVSSPYTIRWADSLATQNNTANGNIVKLTFKIKDDAKAGIYSVSVSHIEARTATGEKVEFADCSSVITVMDYIPGDVDGNREVDDWDAIVLNRYLAGWTTEINLAAADIDGDGELTDWDAIALERRLAGWDA